jgi:hypothetical protein
MENLYLNPLEARVRLARLNMRVAALARHLGVAHITVTRWIKQERPVPPRRQPALLEVLGPRRGLFVRPNAEAPAAPSGGSDG